MLYERGETVAYGHACVPLVMAAVVNKNVVAHAPRVGQVWVAYAAPLRASQRQALRRHDCTRLAHLYSSCFHPSRSPPT